MKWYTTRKHCSVHERESAVLILQKTYGGLKIKKLGFGLMRLPARDPANAASVNIEQLKQMVDRFLERGFPYFDTAWMYNDFASEGAAREALV